MTDISNITWIEFVTWVVVIIAAFVFVGFVLKKNTPLGLVLAGGLLYVLYTASGLNIQSLLSILH